MLCDEHRGNGMHGMILSVIRFGGPAVPDPEARAASAGVRVADLRAGVGAPTGGAQAKESEAATEGDEDSDEGDDGVHVGPRFPGLVTCVSGLLGYG